MTTPLNLPWRTAYTNALNAARAGQLQFQIPDAPRFSCYVGPCAIGVSIPPQQRAEFDGPLYTSVNRHITAGVIKTDDSAQLIRLQHHHDRFRWHVHKNGLPVPEATTQLIAFIEEALSHVA